jgi:hypothetical protein
VNLRPRTPEETYGPALAKARNAFSKLEPCQAATHAAVRYVATGASSGRFQLRFFGGIYEVCWPQGSALQQSDQEDADVATRILLLHYLLTADGTPLSDRWIAFRNLPGGLGYDAAFQRRTNLRLAHAFGTNQQAFVKAAQALRGERLTFGDASFLFRALPRIWLAVILHLKDEEFPASANVLFDAAASHYLPSEDLAVLGGILAGRLIKAAQIRGPHVSD